MCDKQHITVGKMSNSKLELQMT